LNLWISKLFAIQVALQEALSNHILQAGDIEVLGGFHMHYWILELILNTCPTFLFDIWFQLAIKVKNIQGDSYDFNMFGKQVNIVQDTWIWSILCRF
jgi:hypothetical protein